MACKDGFVIVDGIDTCVPWELGTLYCGAGAEKLVFFVDWQPFDCTKLPEPDECPVTAQLELCGDACGPCADPDDECVGRSPNHPHSFCLPGNVGGPPCGPGKPCAEPERACFSYLHPEDPVAQAEADARRQCIDRATCLAAAAELPGGARCEE